MGSPGRIVAPATRTSTRPPPPHRSTPCPYHQLLKNFENAAREAGKDPAQMPKLIELNVEYTNDPESAIEVHRKYWAGTYIPALFDQKIYTPKMSQDNGEAVGPDTIKKSGGVSANPDDHVKFAQKYIELGFTHLIFHSAAQDQRGFLESFGRDVLPRLR